MEQQNLIDNQGCKMYQIILILLISTFSYAELAPEYKISINNLLLRHVGPVGRSGVPVSSADVVLKAIHNKVVSRNDIHDYLLELASAPKSLNFSDKSERLRYASIGLIKDLESDELLPQLLELVKVVDTDARHALVHTITYLSLPQKVNLLEEIFSERTIYSSDDRLRLYMAMERYFSVEQSNTRADNELTFALEFLLRASITEDDDALAIDVLDSLTSELVPEYRESINRVETLESFDKKCHESIQNILDEKLGEMNSGTRSTRIKLDITPLPIHK